jgi:predicted enzyme related to lactoylglutathione lyase
MNKTTGLMFVVPVKDGKAAAKFYTEVFGLELQFENEQITFVGVPGTDSAIGLLTLPEEAGSGPRHIGLHVDHSLDRAELLANIERAGGRVVETGQHAPDVPWARVADPEGNVFEI